ncbi:MAG TPA: ComEC/Rec2 family competence protein [Actinomycetota bacterium]|nr:ComEC/Rec2 family competence protein [Actinomycetota bacterium]
MSPSALPLAAAAVAGGLLAGPALLPRVSAVPVLVAGLAGLTFARRRRRHASPIETSGLLGERERILAAAGFGTAPRARDGSVRLVALVLALVVAGAGWGALRRARPERSGLPDGSYVRFEGSLKSDPRGFAFGWGAEAEVRPLLRDSPTDRSARVWIRGRDRPPSLEAGSRIVGGGTVRLLRHGASSFADHLLSRGVVATLSVRRLERAPGAPPAPLRLANAIRRVLRRGAETALPAREAGLLLGLSIGDVRTMDPEVEHDFRATGLGHLVAVSGSNVAMVLAPVLALATLLRAGPAVRTLVGATAVGVFALVTRWEPSVLRASVMAVLGLLGVLAGRPRSTMTILGGAVLGLLVLDPGLVRSLGFQLSVLATVGLVTLAGPLADRAAWMPRPIALALGATLGAQIAVAPLLLSTFGVVPLASVPANLLALPLVMPALLLGILAAAAAVLIPPVGFVLGRLGAVPLAVLCDVSDRVAKAGFPSVTGGLRAGVVAGALALVLGAFVRRGSHRWRRMAALVTTLGLVAWAGGRAGPPPVLTVTFFDVGQGDGALVRTPEGVNVLVDAGPERDLVATRLAALGVRRLDLAVSSHGHADHIDGFPAVLARHRVALLLDPMCAAESPSYEALRRAAAAEDVTMRPARGGTTYRLGRLVLEILGPDRCSDEGPNDDSVVLRLRYGEATILFPGDAEHAAQQDLLDDPDPVAADVLKVPHHGGDTSLDTFFSAVGARVAVVSTGPNTYGHPVPSVLAALRATGATVLRTDRLGDVELRFEPEGIVVGSRG